MLNISHIIFYIHITIFPRICLHYPTIYLLVECKMFTNEIKRRFVMSYTSESTKLVESSANFECLPSKNMQNQLKCEKVFN